MPVFYSLSSFSGFHLVELFCCPYSWWRVSSVVLDVSPLPSLTPGSPSTPVLHSVAGEPPLPLQELICLCLLIWMYQDFTVMWILVGFKELNFNSLNCHLSHLCQFVMMDLFLYSIHCNVDGGVCVSQTWASIRLYLLITNLSRW